MNNVTALTPGFDCVRTAWLAHETELKRFLARRSGDAALADDLLQEVFLKSLRSGQVFCNLDNPRAWLFQVAKTTLIDSARAARPQTTLPDTLAAPDNEVAAIDQLDQCLLRNLPLLNALDQQIILACDLREQISVREFARTHHLSLPAAKSRLLRARQKLRQLLVEHCQVRLDVDGRVCSHAADGSA